MRQKIAFVAEHVNSKEKPSSGKRKGQNSKTRNITSEYFLEINGSRHVCKGCFCRTLDKKKKIIRLVLENKSLTISGVTIHDQRGKTQSTKKKTEEELEVRNHKNSFPDHESHYARRTIGKKFLPSHLNLTIMYNLYREKYENPASRKIYGKEFTK